eukprot:UN34578
MVNKNKADVKDYKCPTCTKEVYPSDRNTLFNKKYYHPECFVCCNCKTKCMITNFNSHKKKIYCAKCYETEVTEVIKNNAESGVSGASEPSAYIKNEIQVEPSILDEMKNVRKG